MSAKSTKGVPKSNQLAMYNSNPHALKHQSHNGGALTNMVLDSNPVVVQKYNNSATDYKATHAERERIASLRSSQEAPNPAGGSQRNIVFKENDGISTYLRQTSGNTQTPNIKADSDRGRALLVHANSNGQ